MGNRLPTIKERTHHMPALIASLLFFAGFSLLSWSFAHYIKKDRTTQKDVWEDFWENEREASTVIKREFPNQLLLTFDCQYIPYVSSNEALPFYERILEFKDRPMVHLNKMSNNELKKTYGINHFKTLINAEETYFYFLKAIKNYITYLEENEFSKEAHDLTLYYEQIVAQPKNK